METFETMLTGGHPNSLGRTVEVVDAVLADRDRLEELFLCYRSPDAVLRMRVSNALKRIQAKQSEWLLPYIDRLIDEIGALEQPSAQWSLAQLFLALKTEMTPAQLKRATSLMKRNLARQHDWIVLNMTMATLAEWAKEDADLKAWLKPHLERIAGDPRKSVAGKARKALRALDRA